MNDQHDPMHETHGDALHEARNARFLARPLVSWMAAMGVGGLFLGLVGATGSYEYSLGLRLLVWLGLCVVAGLIGLAVESGMLRAGLRWKDPFRWWAALTLMLAAGMVPIILLINSGSGEVPFADLPDYVRNSLVISGGLTALRMGMGTILAPHVIVAASPPGQTAGPRLLKRLKPALQQAKLHAIGSEGHYIRVYTDAGDEMLLMRLKDAMAEVAAVEGMQVHRSWWVAREAVREIERSEGKLALGIGHDVQVPVSRSYREAWREAGWE